MKREGGPDARRSWPSLWGTANESRPMSEVTQILSAIERGNLSAAEQLLPLVYDELRNLAGQKLAAEKPGQTLQATALVHEAYLRLVDVNSVQPWASRRHFFSAAAEAMRRILVDRARRKRRVKHGGEMKRVDLADPVDLSRLADDRIASVNEALKRLEIEEPLSAEVVKLHYFAALPLEEVGELLGMSRATAYREWTYARSWLRAEIERQDK